MLPNLEMLIFLIYYIIPVRLNRLDNVPVFKGQCVVLVKKFTLSVLIFITLIFFSPITE